MSLNAITDVPGIKVGHWSNRRGATGCTVVLAEAGATGAYINAGGAPGTIDTDLLRPENSIQRVHAVLLTGGTIYGQEAAAGVRAHLRDNGVGFRMGENTALIPIVVGANLFDVGIGSGYAHPTIESGRRAAARAKRGRVEQGSVGAGTGCTVAKLDGREFALKSGIGTASVEHESGLVVGAIVAVNAVGDVYDPATGELIAGPRGKRRGQMRSGADIAIEKPLADYLAEAERAPDARSGRSVLSGLTDSASMTAGNTTIGVVATNARLDKSTATRLAIMANEGLAAAIRPAHTPADGDTIFALATNEFDIDVEATPALVTLLGTMAARAVSQAILNGVHAATGLAGVPSPSEWRSRRKRPST